MTENEEFELNWWQKCSVLTGRHLMDENDANQVPHNATVILYNLVERSRNSFDYCVSWVDRSAHSRDLDHKSQEFADVIRELSDRHLIESREEAGPDRPTTETQCFIDMVNARASAIKL